MGFGLVDTSFITSKGYMCIIPNRSQNTLLQIIREKCLPGTTIWSDQWLGYKNINSVLGFYHTTVNHSQVFVCTETGVHIQSIESYWNKQKYRMKKKKRN